MRILLLALTLSVCSCALGPGHNNGGFFAGQAAQDSANAAAQAGQAASQPMFMPSAGGF